MSGYIIITYQDSVTAAGTVCTSTSAGLQRRLLSVLPLLLRFYSHLVFFTITSSTLVTLSSLQSPHLRNSHLVYFTVTLSSLQSPRLPYSYFVFFVVTSSS